MGVLGGGGSVQVGWSRKRALAPVWGGPLVRLGARVRWGAGGPGWGAGWHTKRTPERLQRARPRTAHTRAHTHRSVDGAPRSRPAADGRAYGPTYTGTYSGAGPDRGGPTVIEVGAGLGGPRGWHGPRGHDPRVVCAPVCGSVCGGMFTCPHPTTYADAYRPRAGRRPGRSDWDRGSVVKGQPAGVEVWTAAGVGVHRQGPADWGRGPGVGPGRAGSGRLG